MSKPKNAFVSWDDPESFAKASAAVGASLDKLHPIQRSTGSFANRYKSIDSNTSVRDTFSRLDYEFFRPNESVPKRHKDIIGACMEAYKRVAVVRQVIDLMGDFCSQGIRLVHPNKSIERFYQEWFRQVDGPGRSERFTNLLYRAGNVIIKRATAKIQQDMVDDWKKSIAQIDLSMPDIYTPKKKEIPIRYSFLNPLALNVVGEPIAAFTGQVKYALELPNRVSSMLNTGMFGLDPSVLTNDIPDDIKGALLNGERYLLLKDEKIMTFFYKKDDWEVWAYPMLYSLLDDLIYLEKMKLADLTALDGMISHIRIWKLGSLEHKIFPTDAAIQKLSNILLNHVAGGAMDFIWGPDLTIEETSTDISKFLGSEKYQSVVSSIHSGLGIPAALSGADGTFANNFMSLRTLIERLNYGRYMLDQFWKPEIKFVQKAMGFRNPAQICYDNMNFNDEIAEKALWIQLVDRNIISEQTVMEKFGQIPEIEHILLKREEEARGKKSRGPKVSPFHDAQPHLSKEKIGLQRGAITPGEAGMELKDRLPGEKSGQDIQQEQFKAQLKQKNKPQGVSGQGRPLNTKDSKKRKKRIVKPLSKAARDEWVNLNLYANQLQRIIKETTAPFFLDKFGKSNLRQLNADEDKEFDDFQMALLYNVPAQAFASEDIVISALAQPILKQEFAEQLYDQLINDFNNTKGYSPTFEDIRQIRNLVYATSRSVFNEEDEYEEN